MANIMMESRAVARTNLLYGNYITEEIQKLSLKVDSIKKLPSLAYHKSQTRNFNSKCRYRRSRDIIQKVITTITIIYVG